MKPLGDAVPQGVLPSCSSLMPLVNSEEKMRITEQEWQVAFTGPCLLSNPQTPWPSWVHWSHPDPQQLSLLRCYSNSNRIPFFTFTFIPRKGITKNPKTKPTKTTWKYAVSSHTLETWQYAHLKHSIVLLLGRKEWFFSIFKEMIQIWTE